MRLTVMFPAQLRVMLCATGLFTCALAWGADSPGAVAELPREQVSLEVTSQGRVIRVPAGGDLQDAIDDARPGDTIELEAGSVFRGPFQLPRKSRPESLTRPLSAVDDSSLFITLRSGPAEFPLPPEGTRVSPANAGAMARIEATRGGAIITEAGASHYRFIGLEFRPGTRWLRPDSAIFVNSLVWLHSRSRSAADTPHHFIFERCYFSGDPEVGTRRGLVMNSAYTAVVDSYFADFKMRGEDAQAIIGWAGPGPFLIRNNFLEGSGENVMFGGGDPPIKDLVPADIEIVGNHFAKPLSWREGEPGYDGEQWSVKNLFELKNARRVLVDGNLFEHNWPESQNGFAILFTVRNQEGRAPWSVVEDVTFSNNLVRRVGSGINILGFDDNQPSQQTQRITIRNNVFEDVGGRWGAGDLFQLIDATSGVVIEHNTAQHTNVILRGVGRAHTDFRLQNNIVIHNQYGIVGNDMAPGIATLERYFPDALVRDNLIVGGAGHSYPKGNTFADDLPPAGPENQVSGTGAGADWQALCEALSPTDRAGICEPDDSSTP